MFTVDLHVHTGVLHAVPGRPTPFDPVGLRLAALVARYRGIDAIAITNHDFSSPLPRSVLGVRVLPGIEITTTHGHLLVVGPDPPARTRANAIGPEAAVALAHERGCVAIVAHPFRNSTLREVDAPFDAVEINAKRPRERPRVVRLARERDLPLVATSDAHFPFEVGTAHTAIEAETLAPASVVEAIRSGRLEVHVGEGVLARTRELVYGYVHRVRGHV